MSKTTTSTATGPTGDGDADLTALAAELGPEKGQDPADIVAGDAAKIAESFKTHPLAGSTNPSDLRDLAALIEQAQTDAGCYVRPVTADGYAAPDA